MSLSLITRKFTVEEYEKMATQAIIKPDEKVELIQTVRVNLQLSALLP